MFPQETRQAFQRRLATLEDRSLPKNPRLAYYGQVEVEPGGHGDCIEKSCSYGADHTIRTGRNVVYACRDHIGTAIQYATNNSYA